MLIAAVFLIAAGVKSETTPLKLVQTIKLPDEIKGRFDHLPWIFLGIVCLRLPRTTMPSWYLI